MGRWITEERLGRWFGEERLGRWIREDVKRKGGFECENMKDDIDDAWYEVVFYQNCILLKKIAMTYARDQI